MITPRTSFPLFAIAAALFGISGCCRVSTGSEAQGLSDQEVIALSDRLSAAYLARDLESVRALVAAEYTGSAPGTLWDSVALTREFPKIQMKAIHREAYFVKRLAPDAVLLTEDVTLAETYDGQDISGRYRMNTVWVNRKGRWQLLFEQEVPLPPRS